MGVTQYIGRRYVPVYADPIEWDPSREYESLTIVTHEGSTYTSKTDVPAGVPITNERYWAMTSDAARGNITAQQALELAQRIDARFPVSVENGGTGATTAAEAADVIVGGQNISPASVTAARDVTAGGNVYDGIGSLDQVRQSVSNADNISSGIVKVPNGGTGKSSLTQNAVMLGNGESAIKTISPASGALYATSNTGMPTFGTLPVAQGGTGVTSAQAERNRLGLGNTIGAIPVANGGTGANNAQQALRNITGCLRWVRCGTKTFDLHTTPQLLWDPESFKREFGEYSDTLHHIVFLTNGDWHAVPVTYSAALHNGGVVVTVYGYNDDCRGPNRVNYMVARFD